jgi:hypothetical protein
MQWQQNKKDRKEDRDWSKQQDMIKNVLQERQFKMRKEAFEGEAENREARTNIAQAQFGLARKQYEQGIVQLQAKNEAMSQLWKAKAQGMPNPAAQGQFGPRVGNDPKTGAPPGVSPYIPATDEQLGMFGAKALSAGGNKDAVEMMTSGASGIMDPQSSNFKSSNFNAANNLAEAKRLVEMGIAKNIQDGLFIARTRLSPDATDDRQFYSGGGNPGLANIK